jgi:hypothetical protein
VVDGDVPYVSTLLVVGEVAPAAIFVAEYVNTVLVVIVWLAAVPP